MIKTIKTKRWKMIEILCNGCNKLLAKKDNSIIYIKHKQLSAKIKGKTKVHCPYCGKETELNSND